MTCPGANPGNTTALTPHACKDMAGHSQPVLLHGRTCVMFASANIGVRLVACLHGESAFAVHIPTLMPYSARCVKPCSAESLQLLAQRRRITVASCTQGGGPRTSPPHDAHHYPYTL